MKLFSFFRKGTGKRKRERIAVEAPTNPYYEAISDRFGIAQVILFLTLLAFVAVSLLANTGLITYQNLYYFVKDLNASAESVDVLHTDSLSYAADHSQSFTLYRRGLAVAGGTSVTVFTASGRQTVGESIFYQKPTAVGSGKYLLVYELGGTQYSLYNSYTQIHKGTADGPIRGAAMSQSGSYAIITSSQDHPSVVELFDSDFARVNRYTYRSYVTDVAINEKGSRLAVLLSEHENAGLSTSLRFYEPGKTEISASVNLGTGLGLSCTFTEGGRLTALCSDGIYFTSTKGTVLQAVSFEGKRIAGADLTPNGCGLLLREDGAIYGEALLLDRNGKQIYRGDVGEAVSAIAVSGETLFLTCSDGVLRIHADGETEKVICSTDGRVLLAVDEGRVLLCSSKRADSIRFGY